MEYLSEHWGVIGALIAVIIKFAQDHIRINKLEDDVNSLKNNQQNIMEQNAVTISQLENIDKKTDTILNKINDHDKNIVEFYKSYELKQR